MIRVKDPYGNVLDGIGRNVRSNALVFTKNDQYQQQLVMKKQAERIAQLERQVEKLLQLVEQTDKTNNK